MRGLEENNRNDKWKVPRIVQRNIFTYLYFDDYIFIIDLIYYYRGCRVFIYLNIILYCRRDNGR